MRLGMAMSEMEFALMLGVTVRAVQLWESGAVVPSRLTSMVIRAETAKQAQLQQAHSSGSGRRAPRVHRAGERRPCAGTPSAAGVRSGRGRVDAARIAPCDIRDPTLSRGTKLAKLPSRETMGAGNVG